MENLESKVETQHRSNVRRLTIKNLTGGRANGGRPYIYIIHLGDKKTKVRTVSLSRGEYKVGGDFLVITEGRVLRPNIAATEQEWIPLDNLLKDERVYMKPRPEKGFQGRKPYFAGGVLGRQERIYQPSDDHSPYLLFSSD